MRILAVTPYYHPEGGGLERYAHEILSRLAAQGHDVHAVSFTTHQAGRQTRAGVTVQRVDPLLCLGNTPIHPTFLGTVTDAIDRVQPDVVVAHTPVPFPAEMAYLAASKAQVPIVVTYHAGRLQGSTPWLDTLASLDRVTLEGRMLTGADQLIAVGPYVRDNALAGHREKVTVIPPGVDTDRFTPGGASDGPSGGSNILFVGPLDTAYRWKGVDVLWEAFERVHRQIPEATLTLIGKGDRFDAFAKRAEPLGDAVRLLGRVPDDQLIAEYRDAAIAVLPSTTDAEAFGMVLAEANACGTPVVASDIGGIPDLVRDGDNGLLARPGDPDDLAGRLLQLLEDPAAADRMGQRGRARMVCDHDWDDLATATERVLAEAFDQDTRQARVSDDPGRSAGTDQRILDVEGGPLP